MALDFSQPRLVLGEGKADVAFFKELFKSHKMAGFLAAFPRLGEDITGGWSKFGRYLTGIGTDPKFQKNVKHVVVVGDNDDEKSFGNICDQIAQAGYTVPTSAKQFVRTKGKPDIAILMIPEKPPGCLETLCISAASSKWPELVAPLANYLSATPAATWIDTKQAKMRVQCILASTCAQKPDVALHDHWQKDPEYHIPVNDQAFQGIVEFLTSF